jgi:hypothetical protein
MRRFAAEKKRKHASCLRADMAAARAQIEATASETASHEGDTERLKAENRPEGFSA